MEPHRADAGSNRHPVNASRSHAGTSGRCKDAAFAQIWTSPLERAWHTAQVIAAAQRSRYKVDHRLTERSWGTWEGMLPEEVDQQWPGRRAEGRKPCGHEDDEFVFSRFEAWLADLPAAGCPGPVVAVTHGGFMSAVVRMLGSSDTGYKNLDDVWLADDGGRIRVARREQFISALASLPGEIFRN
jgi:broad specificity phosphatase PhoE